MPWEEIVRDERFQQLDEKGQRRIAENYFTQNIKSDERWSDTPKRQKFQMHRNFLSTIGQDVDSISGTGTLIGAIVNPIRRTLSSTARLLTLIPPVIGAVYEKEDAPFRFFKKEDYENAVMYWTNFFNEIDAGIPQATGKYARGLEGPGDVFDPKRVYKTLAENSGQLVILAGLNAISPVLGMAVIGAMEGAGVGATFVQYEQNTGKKVDPTIKTVAPILVGVANAALEKVGLDKILGPRGTGTRGRIMHALIAGFSEGTTEAIQQVNSIIATLPVDPKTGGEIGRELVESFYAGALLGTVAGGIFGEPEVDPKIDLDIEEAIEEDILEELPEPDEVTTRDMPVTKEGVDGILIDLDGRPIPEGDPYLEEEYSAGLITSGVEKAYAKWRRMKRLLLAHGDVVDVEITSEVKARELQAMSDLATEWIETNPEDVTFDGFKAMLDFFKDQEFNEWTDKVREAKKDRTAPTAVEEAEKVEILEEDTEAGETTVLVGKQKHTIKVVDENKKSIRDKEGMLQRIATALRWVHIFDALAVTNKPLSIEYIPHENKIAFIRKNSPGTVKMAEKRVLQELVDSGREQESLPKEVLDALVDADIDATVGGHYDPNTGDIRLFGEPDEAIKTDWIAQVLVHEVTHLDDWSVYSIEELQKEFGLPWKDRPHEKRAIARASIFEEGGKAAIGTTRPDLVFQVASEEAGKTAPTADQVVRLLRPLALNGIFKQIVPTKGQLRGQVFDAESGTFIEQDVHAAIDPEKGILYLSGNIRMDTIGHEGAEVVINTLGLDNPIVKQGIEAFGDKEKLADAIGEYYAGGQLSDSKMESFGRWLRLLYAEFKNTLGVRQTQMDLVARLNARMLDGREGMLTGRGAGAIAYKRETDAEKKLRILETQIAETQAKIDDPATRTGEKKSLLLKKKSLESDVANFEFQAKVSETHVKRLNLTSAEETLLRTVLALQTKETIPFAETDKQARRILQDLDKMSRLIWKAKKGLGLNSSEATAFGYIVQQATTGLTQLVINPDVTPDDLQISVEGYEDLLQAYERAAGEAGRTLQSFKQQLSRVLYKGIEEVGRELRPEELEEFKKLNKGDPIAVKQFLANIQNPKLSDYFYSFYYNSILSGIPTHLVNFANNALWFGFQVPHKALVSSLDAFYSGYTGKTREVFINEIVPFLGGAKVGFGKGAQTAWELIKTGRTPLRPDTKAEVEMEAAARAFERSPSALLRKIAPYITFPTRALRAADVFANTIAYEAQLRAIAYREAMLDPAKLNGMTTEEYITKFAQNPSSKAMREAAEYARYTTFTDRPGEVTKGIMKVRNKIPGARVVVPFINTISNILKRGMEMTPGLGVAYEGFNRLRGGATQSNVEVGAKQIEGAVLAFLLLGLADDDMLTGDVPRDSAERDSFYRQGKIPWGIKLGGTWYSYRNVEPFNTVLAAVGVAADRIKRAKDEEVTEMFLGVMHAVGSNILDSTYTGNITNLLEENGLKRVVTRFPSSLVPYSGFWRSMNRAVETLGEGDAKVYENVGFTSELARTIPWPLNTPLKSPTKLNTWGEDIILPGGAFRQWLPFKWSDGTIDKTELELAKLGVYPDVPQRTLKIDGREYPMSQDFYRQYAMTYGQQGKKALDKLVRAPGYQRLSDDQKRKVIGRTLNRARGHVRKMAVARLARQTRGGGISPR